MPDADHTLRRRGGALAGAISAGLVLGAADGAGTLACLGDAAGPAASRALVVAGALAVDTLLVVAVLALAGAGVRLLEARVPCLLGAGVLRGPEGRRALRSGVAAAALGAAAGAVALKLTTERMAEPPAAAAALAGLLGVALGLGLLVFAALRVRPAPWAGGRGVAAAIACAAAALAFAVLGAPKPSEGPGAGAPHSVLLVSIDTLRPDRLGAYGAERPTSPHLDALAREGALFEAAYASANWTLPSHATLLSGLSPVTHGVTDDADVLSSAHATLGERFRAAGHRTAAFVATPPRGFVGALRGFGRGFELYRHEPHPPVALEGLFGRAFHRVYRARVRHQVGAAGPQVAAATRWLRLHADAPFLLFVHLYDVHSKGGGRPYDAPAEIRERLCPDPPAAWEDACGGGACASRYLEDVSQGRVQAPSPEVLGYLSCLYDAGVAYADAQVGRLLRTLEETGAAERTVVVVTSDHGEAFLEHGHALHRHLHEEVARIPLLVRAPGGTPGVRVRTPVRLADVAPTVLELAGLPGGATDDGLDLSAAVRDGREPPAEPVLSLGREAALRVGNHKLLAPRAPDARPRALFDLARDPHERENLLEGVHAARHRSLEAELGGRLEAELARGPERSEGAGGRPRLELPEADRRRLEALGYVQ